MKRKTINIVTFITGFVLLFAATNIKASTEEVLGGLILGGIIGSEIQKSKDLEKLPMTYDEMMRLKKSQEFALGQHYGVTPLDKPNRPNRPRNNPCWWAEPYKCPNYNTWNMERNLYIQRLELEIERVNRLENWFK